MLRTRTPEKLKELVEKFRLNIDYYKSADFLETQVRIEFINPLLRLMGWDVDNEAGHAQDYKDVIHELHIGDKRHVDYAFKVGESYKFIIEAKRPGVDLAESAYPVYQARKYAHDTKIRLVIITDFEEFAIYEGYSKYDRAPEPDGDVENRRIFYCKFVDYVRYWNFLYSLLSKKSIMLGLHDHLLARLDDVKSSIQKSVYTVGEFNLLYSIAESFGGENYVVEQDQQIPVTAVTLAPETHPAATRLVSFEKIQVSAANQGQTRQFYLAPLYH